MAVQVVSTLVTATSPVACNCSPWWKGAGQIVEGSSCLVAYTPIGATSAANSYINNANPGTYDAVTLDVAPTWSAEKGWQFNGTSSYLEVGTLQPTQSTWTLIVRYESASASNTAIMVGWQSGSENDGWFINPYLVNGNMWVCNFEEDNSVSSINGGVIAFANRDFYLNGNKVGTLSAAGSINNDYIGIGYNAYGSAQDFWAGYISAMAIYNKELTDAEISAVTVAMNALPNYADG